MSNEIVELKANAERVLAVGRCLCALPNPNHCRCLVCGGWSWNDVGPEFALKLAIKALRADEAEKRAEIAEGLLGDMASDGLPVADVRKLQAALKTLATTVGLLVGDISNERVSLIIAKALMDAEIVTSGTISAAAVTAWNASLSGTPPAAE